MIDNECDITESFIVMEDKAFDARTKSNVIEHTMAHNNLNPFKFRENNNRNYH